MNWLKFLRSFRIANYALFDLAIAFLGIVLLAPLLSRLALKVGLKIPLSSWLFFTLPLSILSHLLVGNKTAMTKNFLDPHGHYLLKILIIILLLLGLKEIKFKP
jgi:hypothetical protein